MNLRTLFYIISVSLLTLVLSSCGITPPKPQEQLKDVVVIETIQPKSKEFLIKANLKYKQQESWLNYIRTATKIWHLSIAEEQLNIETSVWQTLQNVPIIDLKNLLNNHPTSILLADWIEFIRVTGLPPTIQKQQLKNSIIFNPTAIFNHHLSPKLIYQLENPVIPQHIAVMLPLSGDFYKVSSQIKNGIIKNKLQNHPNLIISFYDSTNYQQIVNTYKTAINNGADFIIGPVKREAIQNLISAEDINIDPTKIITLNKSSLPNFIFSSNLESYQITKQFLNNNYTNIAVLANTSRAHSNLAGAISKQWQTTPGNNITLKTFPANDADLQKALGSIINKHTSDDRRRNLQRILQRNLSFFPRTRQDLDAVVLLGTSRQLAVLHPQFQLFNLSMPVYSSARLTPIKLGNATPNKDLNRIKFLTYPATVTNTELSTKLEAFGWDSLTIAMSKHLFAPNTCLDNGMTGCLVKDGINYDRLHIWAQFNREGKIKAYGLD